MGRYIYFLISFWLLIGTVLFDYLIGSVSTYYTDRVDIVNTIYIYTLSK